MLMGNPHFLYLQAIGNDPFKEIIVFLKNIIPAYFEFGYYRVENFELFKFRTYSLCIMYYNY